MSLPSCSARIQEQERNVTTFAGKECGLWSCLLGFGFLPVLPLNSEPWKVSFSGPQISCVSNEGEISVSHMAVAKLE